MGSDPPQSSFLLIGPNEMDNVCTHNEERDPTVLLNIYTRNFFLYLHIAADQLKLNLAINIPAPASAVSHLMSRTSLPADKGKNLPLKCRYLRSLIVGITFPLISKKERMKNGMN